MLKAVIPDDAALGQAVKDELAGVVVRVAAAVVLELVLDQHLGPFKRALWPPGAGLPGDTVCPVGFYGAVDLDVRPPVELVHRGRHPDEHELDLPPGHRVLQFRAGSRLIWTRWPLLRSAMREPMASSMAINSSSSFSVEMIV